MKAASLRGRFVFGNRLHDFDEELTVFAKAPFMEVNVTMAMKQHNCRCARAISMNAPATSYDLSHPARAWQNKSWSKFASLGTVPS